MYEDGERGLYEPAPSGDRPGLSPLASENPDGEKEPSAIDGVIAPK